MAATAAVRGHIWEDPPNRQRLFRKNARIGASNYWKKLGNPRNLQAVRRSGYRSAAPPPRPRSARFCASPGRRSRRFPKSRPNSTTGKWRIRRWVMIASAARIGVRLSTVTAGELIPGRPASRAPRAPWSQMQRDQVAFGEDARDPATVDHRHRADPFVQPAMRTASRTVRGRDLAALVENRRDRHAASWSESDCLRCHVHRQREACPPDPPLPHQQRFCIMRCGALSQHRSWRALVAADRPSMLIAPRSDRPDVCSARADDLIS